MNKRPYFAQNNDLTMAGNRAKYCETIEDARRFLAEHGGGTIATRGTDVYYELVAEVDEAGQLIEIKDPRRAPREGLR